MQPGAGCSPTRRQASCSTTARRCTGHHPTYATTSWLATRSARPRLSSAGRDVISITASPSRTDRRVPRTWGPRVATTTARRPSAAGAGGSPTTARSPGSRRRDTPTNRQRLPCWSTTRRTPGPPRTTRPGHSEPVAQAPIRPAAPGSRRSPRCGGGPPRRCDGPRSRRPRSRRGGTRSARCRRD